MKQLPDSVLEFYKNHSFYANHVENRAVITETDDYVRVIILGKNLIQYNITYWKGDHKKKEEKTDIIKLPIVHGELTLQLMTFTNMDHFINTLQDLIMIVQDAIPHARDAEGFDILFRKKRRCIRNDRCTDAVTSFGNIVRRYTTPEVEYPHSKISDWHIVVVQPKEYEISDSIALAFTMIGDKVIINRTNIQRQNQFIRSDTMDSTIEFKNYLKDLGYDFKSSDIQDIYKNFHRFILPVDRSSRYCGGPVYDDYDDVFF